MAKNQTPGLLRHTEGRYYGRLTLAGKTKFVGLDTYTLEIVRPGLMAHTRH